MFLCKICYIYIKKKQMKKLLQEFKQFAMRGNVIDMAVGVVIGTAFGKIVSSLVADIIMPPIGLLVGNMNFNELAITLRGATVDAGGNTVPAVVLNIGTFVSTFIDFLLIAFSIFLVVKTINTLQRKPKVEEIKPDPLTKDQELLTEIRDLLKK